MQLRILCIFCVDCIESNDVAHNMEHLSQVILRKIVLILTVLSIIIYSLFLIDAGKEDKVLFTMSSAEQPSSSNSAVYAQMNKKKSWLMYELVCDFILPVSL